jgi:copper resistance protein B
VRAFYGDRFEWSPQRGRDAFSWDASAELGGASHRLWLASTGDGLIGGPVEYVEVQALYSRPISESGLALQAGVRRDFVPRPRRTYAVLGMQGNVADAFYVGGFGFLSHRGELTGRLFAYYDLPLVHRLLLQPAVETEIAAADVPELGIGAGPVYVEAGLRLRYRIAEAFSPYVGLNWERLLGRTADFARDAGDEVDNASLVLGVRSYF